MLMCIANEPEGCPPRFDIHRTHQLPSYAETGGRALHPSLVQNSLCSLDEACTDGKHLASNAEILSHVDGDGADGVYQIARGISHGIIIGEQRRPRKLLTIGLAST